MNREMRVGRNDDTSVSLRMVSELSQYTLWSQGHLILSVPFKCPAELFALRLLLR